MGPSSKRQRISGPAPPQQQRNESHEFYGSVNSRERPEDFEDSAIDDEQGFEEEGYEDEDPDAVLEATRRRLDNKLKSKFEAIFEKYGKDFSGVGDEIDLRTGEIIVDNGHITEMHDETDAGDVGKGSGMLRAFTQEPEQGLGQGLDDRENLYDADEAEDDTDADYHVNGKQMLRSFTQEPEFGLGNAIPEEEDEYEENIGKESSNVEEESDDDDILYRSSGVIPARPTAPPKPPLRNQHQQVHQSRVQGLKATPNSRSLRSRASYPSEPDILAQFGQQLGPRIVEYVSQQKVIDDSNIEPKWRAPALSAVTPGKRPILKSILLQPDVERSPSPKRSSLWAPERKPGRPRRVDIPAVQRPTESETVVCDRTFISRELITTSRIPAQPVHRRSEDRRAAISNSTATFSSKLASKPAVVPRPVEHIDRRIPAKSRHKPSYTDSEFDNPFDTEMVMPQQKPQQDDGNLTDENEDPTYNDYDEPTFEDNEQSDGDIGDPNYVVPASEETPTSGINSHIRNALASGSNIRLKNFKPTRTIKRTKKTEHALDMTKRRREKLPFTVEDDELLLEWVKSILFETKFSIWGHKHWRILGAKNPRHTALSWLDRYRKKFVKNGNQHLFPPPNPADQESMEAQRMKPGRPKINDSEVVDIRDIRELDRFVGEHPYGILRESPRTPPRKSKRRSKGSKKDDEDLSDSGFVDLPEDSGEPLDDLIQDERAEDSSNGRRQNSRRSSLLNSSRLQRATSKGSTSYPELPLLEKTATELISGGNQDNRRFSASSTLPVTRQISHDDIYGDTVFDSRTVPNSQSSFEDRLSPPESLSKQDKSEVAAAALLERFRRNTVDPSYMFSDDEDAAEPRVSHNSFALELPSGVRQPSVSDLLIDPALLALDALNAELPVPQHQSLVSGITLPQLEISQDAAVTVETGAEVKEEPEIGPPSSPLPPPAVNPQIQPSSNFEPVAPQKEIYTISTPTDLEPLALLEDIYTIPSSPPRPASAHPPPHQHSPLHSSPVHNRPRPLTKLKRPTKPPTPMHSAPSRPNVERRTPAEARLTALQGNEEADELGIDDDDFAISSWSSRPRAVVKPGLSRLTSVGEAGARGAVRREAAMETPSRRGGGMLETKKGRGIVDRDTDGGDKGGSPGIRTPGGSWRRCGASGFRCQREFCFKCSV